MKSGALFCVRKSTVGCSTLICLFLRLFRRDRQRLYYSREPDCDDFTPEDSIPDVDTLSDEESVLGEFIPQDSFPDFDAMSDEE